MMQTFLRMLAENPGNPDPGLILADYLMEHGDPRESYWRDPLIYAKVFTGVSDNFLGGYGHGDGNGYGHGDGNGDGDGNGYGHGDGNSNGNGYGYGHGYGPGYGDGDGYGYGNGNGDGYGPGYGDGESTLDKFLGMEVLMEGRYILVCDRGFVLVGVVAKHPEDWQRVIVNQCSTVRRWGTSKGLGQLAKEGPLPETILDEEGDGVDVLRATILRAIPCDEEAWSRRPAD